MGDVAQGGGAEAVHVFRSACDAAAADIALVVLEASGLAGADPGYGNGVKATVGLEQAGMAGGTTAMP